MKASPIRRKGLKGRDHIKSDERILGESDFVANVISGAEEALERKYELKRLGYDLDRVAMRVAEIYEMKVGNIFLEGKQRERVKARSLFCYWAVRELGFSLTELARRLNISIAGAGYSVERGETIIRDKHYRLIN